MGIKSSYQWTSSLLTVSWTTLRACSDQRNGWFSLQIAAECSGIQCFGSDRLWWTHWSILRQNGVGHKEVAFKFDSSKDGKEKRQTLTMDFNHINLLKRCTFNRHTLTPCSAVWTNDWNWSYEPHRSDLLQKYCLPDFWNPL